jgi:hypothetical protein
MDRKKHGWLFANSVDNYLEYKESTLAFNDLESNQSLG